MAGTFSGIVEFGSGMMIGRPVSGNLQGITPRQLGVLQEGSVEFAADLKELHGQYQYALVTARGKTKIQGKAKFAAFDIGALSDLYFGLPQTSGMVVALFGPNAEAGTVPAVSTYTITATHAANFVQDYGVLYAATGQPLTRVASVAAAGQYSINVSSGVYTFHSGDASAAVSINYSYNSSSRGATLELTNQLMGYAPEFELMFQSNFRGKQLLVKLNKVTGGKMPFPSKLEDFMMADFDFTGSADSTGSAGTLYWDVS